VKYNFSAILETITSIPNTSLTLACRVEQADAIAHRSFYSVTHVSCDLKEKSLLKEMEIN
jgi:hypothetical protein